MAGKDDKVGYRRPPRNHQFKPGRSGNPRGRPRGKKSIAATLDEELGRLVKVQVGGRKRNVPMWQAVLMRLMQDALKGDMSAMKQVLQLRLAGAGAEEEVDQALGELTEEKLQMIERAIQKRRSTQEKDDAR